jgi:hypothetical protein
MNSDVAQGRVTQMVNVDSIAADLACSMMVSSPDRLSAILSNLSGFTINILSTCKLVLTTLALLVEVLIATKVILTILDTVDRIPFLFSLCADEDRYFV